ncbi:coil containing protein [Vibrio phage 1.031.O._10N.261.46.F8]|nr:coil containing protein [Vibrio phage 1.031.O._10N.261.46.F8]
MSDSVLAQQIAENNRKLQAENETLELANENLGTQVSAYVALGTPEEILEKLNSADAIVQSSSDITESYQNMTESFGGEEVIVESLSRLATFEAEHGSLSDVAEALGAAKITLETLQAFEESHGKLEVVAESQTRMAAKMPEIQEALTLAKGARAFIAERGEFSVVCEALDVAGEQLGMIAEAKQVSELAGIAESYGKTAEEMHSIMENFSITIDQIDEKFAILGFAKSEEVSESNISEEYDEDGKKKYMGDGMDKEEEDDDKEEMSESHKPGRAFSQMITGKAFMNVTESVNPSEVPNKIEESRDTTPGSRFGRMVGAK